jgi:ATP-dependent helicase Lhr and Lhr-like helicase
MRSTTSCAPSVTCGPTRSPPAAPSRPVRCSRGSRPPGASTATVAGEERWVAAEDAARLRDGLGVPPPPGLPEAFLEPVDRPLVDLVARFARTHGPFVPDDVAAGSACRATRSSSPSPQLDREGRVVPGAFRPGGRTYRSGIAPHAGREWCDAEVLRRLRRRSLAALRREVEPVEPTALARFLPSWQGVSAALSGRGSVDRTFEAIERLQGAPIPASVLERDVLPSRVPGYTPAWLDELAAAGEVVWVGRGPLGSDDGRVGLYLRDQAALLAPVPDDVTAEPWFGPVHAGLLERLDTHGASFWPGLQEAGYTAGAPDDTTALEALWDLVWAGLVTNDTFAPVRALVGGGVRRARGRGRRPPRALARSGPPRAAGRWSLVRQLVEPAASTTERGAALAAQLLDRYGVVTRDAAVVEDVRGGFSAVYPVYKAMEESGRARRGYFVEGLGGAQFALPGAVDRLRAVREPGREEDVAAPLVLAATDPANPYGGVLPWPDPVGEHRHSPKRAAGAHVVLVDGDLVLYSERGGRSLVTFTAEEERLAAGAQALAGLVGAGRVDALQLQRIDAEAVGDQPLAGLLRAAGFADHPRGLVLRR